MRVSRLEAEIRAGEEFRQRAPQVVVPEPETIHPGVDLEVVAEGDGMPGGRGLYGAGGRRRGNRRRQRVFEETVQIADAQRPEDEYRYAQAGAAERDPFLDIRTRQHRRARLLEGEAHGSGAMAVRVGFDDGEDRRGAAAGVAALDQEMLNRAKVGLQGGKVDVRDGAADLCRFVICEL